MNLYDLEVVVLLCCWPVFTRMGKARWMSLFNLLRRVEVMGEQATGFL